MYPRPTQVGALLPAKSTHSDLPSKPQQAVLAFLPRTGRKAQGKTVTLATNVTKPQDNQLSGHQRDWVTSPRIRQLTEERVVKLTLYGRPF